MKYKVLIPTAGLGSRLDKYTKYLNKSLISINLKPILSWQIEKFSEDTVFVIALGYKGKLVKQFLQISYPSRKFIFVDVDNYKGDGSGLGYSIIQCRNYLNEPFIFMSCDTLVEENIPSPNCNWMGYSNLENDKQYRSLKVKDKLVFDICEKEVTDKDCFPYIGLAGINKPKEFWDQMIKGKEEAIRIGESYALKNLIKTTPIKSIPFTWHDTGNLDSLKKAKIYFQLRESPTILEKENECIWFVNDKVIKFSDDKEFIKNRVKRSKIIKDFIPHITDVSENMYAYKKADGEVLSNKVNIPKFINLLKESSIFWKDIKLSKDEFNNFKNKCLDFYKVKTEKRIDLFFKKFNHKDTITYINGEKIPKVKDLILELDWNHLSEGIPSDFHGDFHLENILYDDKSKKFIFLDWRQDFASNIKCGDRYYDFAKLMHGLIVNHKIIEKNLYSINWINDDINFDLNRTFNLVQCENYFNNWLNNNTYSSRKVYLLTSLIYLNIAGLHHYPYSELLFSLGKSMLYKNINNLK
ncbi:MULTISPECIES: nucleoside-diphosphate-sugar pyrophosphorylase [unclassified Prochlorococcus]|uniref:nucleoside-diphosphate-sugar pyrophosphorylase n=1 Tax=unclassified Prochlorococcus TaxID=2627481 RepID=UPI00097CC543|nr:MULTISPECIES: nucleoside-diphosphate-sugar pyrophosphorylase [unclassified Prochlorococcus]AQL29798.1 nucleoside-diphosphate-sugar pyrophosphorylase [Prochlorococcus sp. RS50]AQL31572.1 nucleoside-diphosphate-sugar pyrophosphorylase [Prochlorococcus sp. RS01]AQL34524.1 nucleoside-diphosphate-sugar pyrophosphorylase [Prochlorococcus sp. RS04]